MIRLPTGIRWSCHGCGSCCTGHELGPVEPEVIPRLLKAGIGELWPAAGEGWYDERPDGIFLRQVGGACVFLRPDKLCAVHALVGGDAKPGFCREFPYHFVDDPRGTVAVIRATCAGFYKSFRDGAELDEATVEAAALLPRVAPRTRFAPATVIALPGAEVALDSWLDMETAVIALLESETPNDPAISVGRVRDELARRCGVELLAPRPEQYDAAVRALTFTLTRVLEAALQAPGGQPHQVDFARDCRALMITAHEAEAPSPLDAEAHAWTDLLLRSQLLARQWSAWGGVAEGLGVWLLGIEIARRAIPRVVTPSSCLSDWAYSPIQKIWTCRSRASSRRVVATIGGDRPCGPLVTTRAGGASGSRDPCANGTAIRSGTLPRAARLGCRACGSLRRGANQRLSPKCWS